MADNGLTPVKEADKRALIRRLSFDLIGLPPTPEEVEAFENDDRPDAYERLVDRLLASPHYGERWGRHWLDLVRYAETHGYERDDPKPSAWRYRDWVVRALNRDMPYDRFLMEQIAGDELPDSNIESKIATGMFRLGLVDDEPADPAMDRYDQLDDMVKTVGTTMLGVTIHCARCHDHKFDPITQKDYYQLLAFFTPSKPYVRDQNESISVQVASEAERGRRESRIRAVEAKLRPLKEQLDAVLASKRRELLQERLLKLSNDALGAYQTPRERRDETQKKLLSEARPRLEIKPEEVDAALDPGQKTRVAELKSSIALVEAERPETLPTGLALTDSSAEAPPTKLLTRGDAHKPGAEVKPGFLSAIDPVDPNIVAAPGAQTTGRRLALARWIASPTNPLTARVIVNRLWQHHFGRGIVATPSDFGSMGDEPSHPELLDWLANELIAGGWRLKPIHRLIVLSSAYRRSVEWNESSAGQDADSVYLWRRVPLRLEAEPIRDAILSVSGALNSEIGGPSVTPPIAQDVLARQSRPGSGWGASDPKSAFRRSIYVRVKRSLPLPELEVMDAPDTAEPCPRRPVTTIAPQALTLLNSAFSHEQALFFAERLKREAGDDSEEQIQRAFRLAFSRPPSETEVRDAAAFLDAQVELVKTRSKPEDRSNPKFDALRAFCLVLLSANEFVTVD